MALPRERNWGRVPRESGRILSEEDAQFEPAVHWVFAKDIDASYQELKSLGANIVDPLEKKTLGDYGNSP
jgi:hypothetical protein